MSVALVERATGPGRFEVFAFDLESDSTIRLDGAVSAAHVVVKLHGEPLGLVTVEPEFGCIDGAAVMRAVAGNDEIVERMRAHDGCEGGECVRFALPAGASWPTLSVVVPTRNRPDSIARCVRSLAACDYPDFEVVVVDNGSSSLDEIASVVDAMRADVRITLVSEPAPGASRARNTGLAASSGEIVVFCDDDVEADSLWLRAVAHRLVVDPEAQCVTGLVVPAELATDAQVLFEQYGGFGKGFAPLTFDLDAHRPDSVLFPWTAGRFGSGNNVAFRREALTAIGGYDVRLGPGTPTRAGEDLDVFVRIVRSGRRLVYEPAAVVSHYHRRTLDELHGQIHDYGIGLSSMLLLRAVSEPGAAREITRRVIPGVRLLTAPSSTKNAAKTQEFPRSLVRAEVRGMLAGPVALASAHRNERAQTGGTGLRVRARRHLDQPLFRNAWALMANTAVTALLGVLYWAIAAQLYPAASVGRAASAIAAMTLVSGISQLNLISGIPRFLPVAGAEGRRFVVRAYGATTALTALVATLFLFLDAATGVAGDITGGSIGLAVWFVLAAMCWTVFTLQDSVLAALRAAVWVPIENGLFGVAKIAIAMAVAGVAVTNGLFASWTIPVMVSLIPMNLLIFGKVLPRRQRSAAPPAKNLYRQALHLGLGDYPGSLAYLASVTAMPVVMVHLAGVTAAGYFYPAWMLVVSADLVLSAIATSVTVEGAHDQDGLAAVVRKAARLTAAVVVPATLVLVVAAPLVLSVFGAGYRDEATGLLRAAALALPARGLVVMTLAVCRVTRRPRRILSLQLASAIGLLGGTVLLVPAIGLVGVGVAYLVTQVVLAAVTAPFLIRIGGRPHSSVPAVTSGAAA